MSKVTSKISINGEVWNGSHLERLEYERNLFTLHQLKRRGVEIKDGDSVLSHDDIDYLSQDKAWEVSINTRAQCPGEKLVEIFDKSFERSDAMWRELAFSHDEPMRASYCYIEVTGVLLNDYMEMIRQVQVDERTGLATHPEHYFTVTNTGKDKINGIEAFGMYGTPPLIEVRFTDIAELGKQILADMDSEYPVRMAGRTFLRDGVTEVNCPFHQFKSTDNGFAVKTAVYWAENAPEEIVSGHSLHLAMEFYRDIKFAKKQN